MKLAGEGRYEEALQVILNKNALPFITGTICAHGCQSHCTRNFYETPVQIRDTKLLCAGKAYDSVINGRPFLLRMTLNASSKRPSPASFT